MRIDLQCHGDRGKIFPFSADLLDHPLDHLIEDARNAYRVYELFSIRRPGDLWKYLWVRLIDVPDRVWEWYRSAQKGQAWPDQAIPLRRFDQFFFWCGDDTDPEAECWLRTREGNLFREWVIRRYAQITQAQEILRGSDDPLIQYEIQAIHRVQHPYDYEAERPFSLTGDDYSTITLPKRTPGYYEKLLEVLASPEVQSVACRGDDDFQTIRLMCAEQRKRAEAAGKPPRDVLPISILSDGISAIAAWQAWIRVYWEGLGYGDLWVEQQYLGTSVKDLVERYERRKLLFFLYEDQGEIQGYQRTLGNGWVLYRDQDPDNDYRGLSQAYYERFPR